MKLKISGYIDNLRRFILIFELVDVREEVCGETFTKKCYISFRNIILEKRKEDFSTYVILISDSPYSSRNDGVYSFFLLKNDNFQSWFLFLSYLFVANPINS